VRVGVFFFVPVLILDASALKIKGSGKDKSRNVKSSQVNTRSPQSKERNPQQAEQGHAQMQQCV
jgi:hypothetical protein